MKQEKDEIKKFIAPGITDWYLRQGRFFQELVKEDFKVITRICILIFLTQLIIFVLILFLLLQ